MTRGQKKTALIGGGGHALSLLQLGLPVDGYVDRRECPGLKGRLPWLGDDAAFLASCSPDDWRVHIAIVGGSGKEMGLRNRIARRYQDYDGATLIAPTAIVAGGSRIGEGSAVMHGAIINGATLGRRCIVNTGAVVEHGCAAADNVFIGPGATVCGGVTIGDDCFIGAGATVRNCVTICSGVTIGIGAAVAADITEPGVYTGVPAKKRSL